MIILLYILRTCLYWYIWRLAEGKPTHDVDSLPYVCLMFPVIGEVWVLNAIFKLVLINK